MPMKTQLPTTTAPLSADSRSKEGSNVPRKLGKYRIKVASAAQPGLGSLVSVVHPSSGVHSSPNNPNLQQRRIQKLTHQCTLQPRLTGEVWKSFEQHLPKNPMTAS